MAFWFVPTTFLVLLLSFPLVFSFIYSYLFLSFFCVPLYYPFCVLKILSFSETLSVRWKKRAIISAVWCCYDWHNLNQLVLTLPRIVCLIVLTLPTDDSTRWREWVCCDIVPCFISCSTLNNLSVKIFPRSFLLLLLLLC